MNIFESIVMFMLLVSSFIFIVSIFLYWRRFKTKSSLLLLISTALSFSLVAASSVLVQVSMRYRGGVFMKDFMVISFVMDSIAKVSFILTLLLAAFCFSRGKFGSLPE